MTPDPSSPPPGGPDDAPPEAPAGVPGAVELDPETLRAARVAATRGEGFEAELAVEDGEGPGAAPLPPGAHQGVARNTVIFSIATGASRVAGLAREIVAASYFGTSGAASAFTIAFQVPNLVRGLFADAALSAAFVPVFTEYLEKGKRREALLLASTLFWIILLVLGAVSALFILIAPYVIPALIGGQHFTQELIDLTVGLSRVLFPIVVLLGLNGLLAGVLNAHHHFTIPAIAPLVWNIVIIVALVVLRPAFDGQNEIYAYAIGVLIGTLVQLLMVIPALRGIDFRLQRVMQWRGPAVRRVFTLMLPVTIGLGVINIDLLINSLVGALISDAAPRAIDAAFRIYMLPQGLFSVALATVLFPAVSRLVARGDTPGVRALLGTGTRQNLLLLIPASVATMVLATPITRLLYEYGKFGPASTDLVSTALFWFSFSLPFAGVNLLTTRTFFSLQLPWIPTRLAAANLVVNLVLSLALYGPFGVAGPVIGTVVASAGMTFAQGRWLRRELGGTIEGGATLTATVRILAASAALAAVTGLVYLGLDHVLGHDRVLTRLIPVATSLALGFAVYAAAVTRMGVPEADQIRRFVTARLRRA